MPRPAPTHLLLLLLPALSTSCGAEAVRGPESVDGGSAGADSGSTNAGALAHEGRPQRDAAPEGAPAEARSGSVAGSGPGTGAESQASAPLDWDALVRGESPLDERFGEGSSRSASTSGAAAGERAEASQPPALDPADWVPLSEFDGVPVTTYRETDARTGRLERIGTKDADGVDHGPEWSLFANGVVRRRQSYSRGQLDGPFVACFDTGMLRAKGSYALGGQTGEWERYSSEGALLWSKSYRNGNLHGPYLEWYHAGVPKIEAEYVDGLQSGTERLYSEVGLKSVTEWVAGERHGAYREFEPESGALVLEGQYEHGLRSGTWVHYSPEQSHTIEESFVADKLEGLRRQWHPDGSAQSEETYSAGVKNGPSRAWFQGGQDQMQGDYVEGLREGAWTYWKEDGSVDETFSGTYHEGQLLPGSAGAGH